MSYRGGTAFGSVSVLLSNWIVGLIYTYSIVIFVCLGLIADCLCIVFGLVLVFGWVGYYTLSIIFPCILNCEGVSRGEY